MVRKSLMGQRMNTREDIFVERSTDRAAAIEKAITKLEAKPGDLAEQLIHDPKARIRRTLVEPDTSDPNGFERIIGRSDLVSINFLARGLKAARAVCRVRVPAQTNGWYGTGFGLWATGVSRS
jgi:endonuclease G, mitochondrial